MGKERKDIPKAIKEKVLKEFSYKCAKCGSENPQLHHLDENPSNNDVMNIIPLCPNCHLTDQHNPTKQIESDKLRLFRKYKDPTILNPAFHPLYQRFGFLQSVEAIDNFETLQDKISELVCFIENLEMGSFYSKKIQSLTEESAIGLCSVLGDSGSESRRLQAIKDHNEKYRQQIIATREEIIDLIVELLRYQKW
jgi:hypothetical protein